MRISIYDSGAPPGSQTIGGSFVDVNPPTAEVLLLLKSIDASHWNPAEDLTGSYKRGDIIEVLPPTKHNGNTITNPISAPFWIVRVTSLPLAPARLFESRWVDVNGVPQRRRLFRVNVDGNAALLAALTATRYAVVSWSTIRTLLINKETGRGQ